MFNVIRVAGVAVVAACVAVASAGPAGAVDDDAVVAALLDEASRFGVDLDRECVGEVVDDLDASDLALTELVHGLEGRADNSDSSAPEAGAPTTPPSWTAIEALILDPGFLVFNSPSPTDLDALRVNVIQCVVATADPDLVAAVLPALAGMDKVFPLACVEPVLTTFEDETLELMLSQSESSVPPDLYDVVITDVRRFTICASYPSTDPTETTAP